MLHFQMRSFFVLRSTSAPIKIAGKHAIWGLFFTQRRHHKPRRPHCIQNRTRTHAHTATAHDPGGAIGRQCFKPQPHHTQAGFFEKKESSVPVLAAAAAGAAAAVEDEAAAAAVDEPPTCTPGCLLLLLPRKPFLLRLPACFASNACCSRSAKAVRDAFAALRSAFFSRFAMLSASILGFGPVPLRAPPLPPPSARLRPTIGSSSRQQQPSSSEEELEAEAVSTTLSKAGQRFHTLRSVGYVAFG